MEQLKTEFLQFIPKIEQYKNYFCTATAVLQLIIDPHVNFNEKNISKINFG